MNLNKAMLIGNLTRDPEIRTTPTGQSVASFSVATNYVWVDQQGQKHDKPEFHNIVAWRRLAEIVGQYLKKGSKIYLEGRLQTRDWVGQDGVKRYRTEIIADNMIMLDRAGAGSSGGQFARSEQPPMPSEPVIDVEEAVGTGTMGDGEESEEEIRVENIPF